MNDPIKIIFKYKNNNGRLHHHIYIYIGNVSKKIMGILNTIKNISLYECFINLSKNNFDMIVRYYGDKWYNKFYNTHHINFIIYTISKSKHQQNEIIKKRGKDWYCLLSISE